MRDPRKLLLLAMLASTILVTGCLRFGFSPVNDAGVSDLDSATTPGDAGEDGFVCPTVQGIDFGTAPEPTCDPSTNWCWELPAQKHSNQINHIWQGQVMINGVPTEVAYAVGNRGIFITRINGVWHKPEIVSDRDLHAVVAADDLVVVAGQDEIRIRSGGVWTFQRLTDYTINALSISNAFIRAAGDHAGAPAVLGRTIGGPQFTEDTTFPAASGTLTAIDEGSDRIVVVGFSANNGQSLAYIKDTGVGWTPVPGAHAVAGTRWFSVWTGVDGQSQKSTFLGGDSGQSIATLAQFSAGAVNSVFVPCSFPAPCRVESLAGEQISSLTVVTNQADVSILNGIDFTTNPVPPIGLNGAAAALHTYSGTGSGPADITVVGQAGSILQYDGAAWTQQGNTFPFSIWHGHSRIVDTREATLAVSHNRIFARIDDSAWGDQLGPPLGTAIWLNQEPCSAWAGGMGGVARFQEGWLLPGVLPDAQQVPVVNPDGGVDASVPDGGAEQEILVTDIWGTSHDNLWAVGYPGVWHWNGSQWRMIADAREVGCSTEGNRALALAVRGTASAVIVVGSCSSPIEDGFIARCTSETCTISASKLPDVLFGIWTDGNQNLAIGSLGGLPSIRRFGTQSVGQPSTDEFPPGIGAAVTAIAGNNVNDIWVVTSHGFAAHWDGANWSAEATVSDTLLLSLWISPSNKLYVGGESGTLISKQLSSL